MEKVTAIASLTRVRVMVDHTMTTPLQRSKKLRSRTDILISVFTPSRLRRQSKTSSAIIFLRNFFTHMI